jgi:hypothetical protein
LIAGTVPSRQRHDLSALVGEERVAADDERAGSKLDKGLECCVDLARGARSQDISLEPERTRCILHASRFGLGAGVGRIAQHSDDGGCRHQFVQ